MSEMRSAKETVSSTSSEMKRSQRLNSYALGALCFSISGGFLCWLIVRIDTGKALLLIQDAQWPWLVAAAFATLLVPVCSAWRWLGVLHAQDGARIGFAAALRATMLANVFNVFLPSKSGDMAKALYLRRRCGVSSGVGTVLLERMVDLSVLGLLGAVGFLFGGAVCGLVVGGLLLGTVTLAFLCIAFVPLNRLPLPKRVREAVDAVSIVFQSWMRTPAAVGRTLVGSFGVWTLGGFIVCALASAIHPNVQWGNLLSILPAAVLAGLVPVTISGIGTRDAAFVALLSGTMPLEVATLIGIGYTIFVYWLVALISLPGAMHEVVRFLFPKDDPAAAPLAREAPTA